MEAAQGRRRSGRPKVEDDDCGDVAGRLRMRGSSGMTRTTRQSRRARRLLEGWPVSAVAVCGGDGGVRAREGKKAEKGERVEGE